MCRVHHTPPACLYSLSHTLKSPQSQICFSRLVPAAENLCFSASSGVCIQRDTARRLPLTLLQEHFFFLLLDLHFTFCLNFQNTLWLVTTFEVDVCKSVDVIGLNERTNPQPRCHVTSPFPPACLVPFYNWSVFYCDEVKNSHMMKTCGSVFPSNQIKHQQKPTGHWTETNICKTLCLVPPVGPKGQKKHCHRDADHF